MANTAPAESSAAIRERVVKAQPKPSPIATQTVQPPMAQCNELPDFKIVKLFSEIVKPDPTTCQHINDCIVETNRIILYFQSVCSCTVNENRRFKILFRILILISSIALVDYPTPKLFINAVRWLR